MILTELQSISILILTAFCLVIYLLIRQRNDNIERLRHSHDPDFYPVIAKPSDYMNRSFPGVGQNLPSFPQNEGFQKRPFHEYETRNINPRISQNTSGIEDRSYSRFETRPKDTDQSRIIDKSYESKYVPYEPSREMDGFQQPQKKDELENKPHWSRIESSVSQVLIHPSNNGNSNREIEYSKHEIIEETPFVGERRENARTSDSNQINDFPDLENEYKVFRDFKLREGRNFHDETKKDGSPRRSGKRLSGLDRVGHSPDSPFRMFESPANSKKKINGNKPDTSKPNRPQQVLASKKDSFARTQEALNQKEKQPVRTVPHSQRSVHALANQRNERKTKINQVFIENNNSDDEMHVEEQKDHIIRNKRAPPTAHSIDNYERESGNKKFVKTNDYHPKGKTIENRKFPLKSSYNEEPQKKEQRVPIHKKPSVDLSYMTEYGRNSSLQKYVEKKTRIDETNRPNKPSTPNTNTKMMSVERSPQPPAQKTQDKVNAGSFRPPSSLARKEEVVSNTKKILPSESAMTEEKEKSSEKPVFKESKGLFDTKTESKPALGVKPEGAKISSILGGSSLFAQSKPAETGTNGDAKEESKFSKSLIAEKVAPEAPTTQQPVIDLFKTVKTGKSLSAVNDDSKDQPQAKIPHIEEASKESGETNKLPGLFSKDKKEDGESGKPAIQSLFKGSTNGLFANLGSANQSNVSVAADEKKEGSNIVPKSTSGLGLFNNDIAKNKPQETNTDGGQNAEEKPKPGLFNTINATPGPGFLFAGQVKSGLFANSNKDSNESVKKDDPLAFAKKPEGFSNPAETADDSKQKVSGLFANLSGASSSLFKPSGGLAIGNSGSGLFLGGILGKDDKPKTSGLFANLNNGNASNEKTG